MSLNRTYKLVYILSFGVIFCSYNFVFAELIQPQSCYYTPSNSCEILNVTIDPCPEASYNEPCNLYRGTNSTVTLYYRPKFSGKKLTVQRYSVVLVLDIPDPTFHDHDGCKFAPCPYTADGVYKFQQNFGVLETYPTGVYHTKFKLWNEDDQECCFGTLITIV